VNNVDLSHFYGLLLAILGVWRITHLLAAEDGPWDIIFRLRRKLGNAFFGRLMDCFFCLTLWVAAPFAWLLADSWKERILLWLASSGGACLVEMAVTKKETVPHVEYREDKEEKNE
jgi:hypothetical protein